jgi:pSer/pThr/pTyr-binding forkhead associated (FHA) protein
MLQERTVTFFHQRKSREVLVRWMKSELNEPVEKDVKLPISFGRHADNQIVLASKQVSRRHAVLKWHENHLMLIDQGSTNGIYINGQRQEEVIIQPGDKIGIGEYTVVIEPHNDEQTVVMRSKSDEPRVLPFCPHTDQLQPVPSLPACSLDSLPALFAQPIIPMSKLERARIPLRETTYLTIGGGMGSFAWVDQLVICGADPKQIAAIGFSPMEPYGRFKNLCDNSQIPLHERLRSNSDACLDNVWGWPGYAVREIWGHIKQGDLGQAARISSQIFNEPLVQTYTPRARDVYQAIDREATRIGWDNIWREGRVEAIRKTDDGRYAVLYSAPEDNGQESCKMIIIADYLHLAVGYPGVRFLADLVEYRQRTGDTKQVVNAYEEHEYLYQHLSKHGGTVMIRGRGIVASRIIQRLYEIRMKRVREKGKSDIQILHLMRTPKPEGQKYDGTSRQVENHWEFQPFNWPKSVWGGHYLQELERANDVKRDELLAMWGGTTTPNRHDWRDMIESGRKEGWYDPQFGKVERVECDHLSGKVVTTIRSQNIDKEQKLNANFIIDATGLDAALKNNPLLKNLYQLYDLKLNPTGRLQTTNDFELKDMRNGNGRMYAVGAMTLGNGYAPVDSFLGLQYAALRSADHLVRLCAPGLKKLNGIRSIRQWTRWARGVSP